jgi:CheY-like chemotaxis protein
MKKILIVDDDRKIAIALAARMRSLGVSVSVAQDGLGAVMAARTEQPDAIVMDINMPAGGGLTAAERILDLSLTCGVPIVFITASKDPELLARAKAISGIPALEKPFDAKDLVDVLEEHIGELQPN